MKTPFVILILFILFSCKKEGSDIAPAAIYNVGIDVRITDIELVSDSVWIACGGIRNKEGYIFRTIDAGAHWSSHKVEFPSSVYTVSFSDSIHGYAGGDYLNIWETSDGGITWQFRWLGDEVPFNEQDRPAIHRFCLKNDEQWFFCGGENLGEGVIYESNDKGVHWRFRFYQHELRAVDLSTNGELIAGGHGLIIHSSNGIDNIVTNDWENDFITCLAFITPGRALAAGFNGGIYISNDAGVSWNETRKTNKPYAQRTGWNDLDLEYNTIITVGKEGHIAVSGDNGNTWNDYVILARPHLFSCALSGNSCLTTGDHGTIYKIDL